LIGTSDEPNLGARRVPVSSSSFNSATMAKLETTQSNSDYPVPRDDEESLTLHKDWTPEEERKAKRKQANRFLCCLQA
jgi:hypothetical protein